MIQLLRVLMLEDSDADADLIVAALKSANLGANVHRVKTREAFGEAMRAFAPDVVLCDHAVPHFSVRAAMELLRAARPAAPLIVVTGSLDGEAAVSCIRAGAEDVVLKSNLGRLAPAIAAAIEIRRRLDKLSPRQLEVLRLVAEGLTTPAISQRLGLSEKTVETHRSELMKRLDIHDVVTLVRYAVRLGLVAPD
jgi:DNA-binding NarL/FixJ family response regulator